MLQSRPLPHAETCLWWMEMMCGRGWTISDVKTMDSIHNLGALYANQGKLKQAEEIYLRALAGKEKALDLDHTSTLGTVNNLGAIYADQGKLKEADEMYQRALAGYAKTLGQSHHLTQRVVTRLNALIQSSKPRRRKLFMLLFGR